MGHAGISVGEYAPLGGTCLVCLTPAGRQCPKDQGDLSVFGTLQPAPKTDNLPNEAPAWLGDSACWQTSKWQKWLIDRGLGFNHTGSENPSAVNN